MENRLCPLSLGRYLWISAVNGSVCVCVCLKTFFLRGERCCCYRGCITPGGGADDKRPFISPTSHKDNSRLGPCCRLGGLALLLSLWTCESPVTDGRDILPYLLPFPVTCNMYSFLKTTAESQQLSTPLPTPPCVDWNKNSPDSCPQRVNTLQY